MAIAVNVRVEGVALAVTVSVLCVPLLVLLGGVHFPDSEVSAEQCCCLPKSPCPVPGRSSSTPLLLPLLCSDRVNNVPMPQTVFTVILIESHCPT